MEFTVNLMEAEADVAQWSRRRESQGWHQLSVADHFFTQRPFPHVWVTAATMAATTTTVAITTAFVNNLFRSPVEVAQAALMLQHTSGACTFSGDYYTVDVDTLGPLSDDAGYGRFFGDVAKVADGIAWLESIGVSRAQLSPFDDTSLDRLAPAVL